MLFISREKERTLFDSVLNLPKGMPKKYIPNGFDLIYRPKYLKGIENNNGWISINSEDDLPKESDTYWCILNDNATMLWFDFEDKEFEKEIYHNLKPTHYQPINKPQSPLYK